LAIEGNAHARLNRETRRETAIQKSTMELWTVPKPIIGLEQSPGCVKQGRLGAGILWH
jgi:hypothetical protein